MRQPDITRARQLLDWEPEVDIREGLRLTIEHYANVIGSPGVAMSSEAKNLEAISKAIDQHNQGCEWPAVAVELNPFELERLGWDSIRGLPIRANAGARHRPLPRGLRARGGRARRGGRGGGRADGARRAGHGALVALRAELHALGQRLPTAAQRCCTGSVQTCASAATRSSL